MTVDFFLVEGPRAVPDEFRAWQEAYREWYPAAQRALSYEGWSESERTALNDRAVELGRVAQDLERKARAAFLVWCKAARP
jgi:hypothetical protein